MRRKGVTSTSHLVRHNWGRLVCFVKAQEKQPTIITMFKKILLFLCLAAASAQLRLVDVQKVRRAGEILDLHPCHVWSWPTSHSVCFDISFVRTYRMKTASVTWSRRTVRRLVPRTMDCVLQCVRTNLVACSWFLISQPCTWCTLEKVSRIERAVTMGLALLWRWSIKLKLVSWSHQAKVSAKEKVAPRVAVERVPRAKVRNDIATLLMTYHEPVWQLMDGTFQWRRYWKELL